MKKIIIIDDLDSALSVEEGIYENVKFVKTKPLPKLSEEDKCKKELLSLRKEKNWLPKKYKRKLK